MTDYLVISALGKDRPGIVNQLSNALLDAGCNIAESRMAVLGGEFALMLLVNGEADTIDGVKNRLADLESSLGLTLIAKATQPRPAKHRMAPYQITVVAMDHPGIVRNVSQFFAERQINIEELATDTYAAAHTGTTMFSLTMTISLPSHLATGELREQFLAFCDQLNLDATLNPARR